MSDDLERSATSLRAGGADRLDRFHVGYEDRVSRLVTEQDVSDFARLSGDYNELHTDEEFANRTAFGQRVVHGFLHASLLSRLVGMKIPGAGALYLSQSIEFTRPVFIGDTVTARGVVENIDRATRVLTIATTITNQRGEIVLDGKARAKVLQVASGDEGRTNAVTNLLGTGLLRGKFALVTGASRGIGREIARLLCAQGAHVHVNYRTSERAAESLVAELTAAGGRASAVKADVTDKAQAERMIQEVAGLGELDILVNNAGPKIVSTPFADLTWPAIEAAHAQIVGGVFHVTHAALPSLKARRGRIVNVLTTAAFGRTAHNWLPYVMAKAAIFAMSKNLAQELGPHGVRVNMVSPSLTETDLTAEIPARIKQMMVSGTPLRRLATTHDVAGAVLFLASPLADFITGENLFVSGGETMS